MAEKKDEIRVWNVPGSFTKFRNHDDIFTLPDDWIFVNKGDAALTRRIKATGDYWVVQTFYKQKPTAAGLCAPKIVVERIKAELFAERENPAYQKKLEQGRRYRAKKEVEYQGDFKQSILDFLAFHPRWAALADQLAVAVTKHATPVGSGTVARTERIPIEQRAEAAVIAWMRHQTTNYDHMHIDRIAGERRQVRGTLAEQSREVLAKYRSGNDIDLAHCPLAIALQKLSKQNKS